MESLARFSAAHGTSRNPNREGPPWSARRRGRPAFRSDVGCGTAAPIEVRSAGGAQKPLRLAEPVLKLIGTGLGVLQGPGVFEPYRRRELGV